MPMAIGVAAAARNAGAKVEPLTCVIGAEVRKINLGATA
jgi:hypothetical protein